MRKWSRKKSLGQYRTMSSAGAAEKFRPQMRYLFLQSTKNSREKAPFCQPIFSHHFLLPNCAILPLVCLLVLLLAVAPIRWRWQAEEGSPAFAPVRTPEYQLILDAGHGGEDGGAVSVTGVPESGINLSIVLKLDQLLGFYGVSPRLLRTTDISLHDSCAETLRQKKVSDLKNRVAAVESVENGVLISIHQNSFSNAAYHGSQVFFREGEESKRLAEQVQAALREGVNPDNRRTPAKIPDSVYLMKHITRPAVLVECGFLSNPAEEEKLRSGGYQTKLALCVAGAWLGQDVQFQGSQMETFVVE